MTTFKMPEPGTLYYRHGEELKYYNKAQLTQAVKDVLEQAAQVAERGFRYAKDGDQIADAIRKMIGEIK